MDLSEARHYIPRQPVSQIANFMTERPVQRRLVAILAADVVGLRRAGLPD
jgi:hypothetical protein